MDDSQSKINCEYVVCWLLPLKVRPRQWMSQDHSDLTSSCKSHDPSPALAEPARASLYCPGQSSRFATRHIVWPCVTISQCGNTLLGGSLLCPKAASVCRGNDGRDKERERDRATDRYIAQSSLRAQHTSTSCYFKTADSTAPPTTTQEQQQPKQSTPPAVLFLGSPILAVKTSCAGSLSCS